MKRAAMGAWLACGHMSDQLARDLLYLDDITKKGNHLQRF